MSNEDDDMEYGTAESIEELIEKLKELTGVDKEIMAKFERTAKAQHDIGMILSELEPNEAAQTLVGAVVSVCVSYSESIEDALACLAKMQASALRMIEKCDSAGATPWNSDDEENDDSSDFPVNHKTKQ